MRDDITLYFVRHGQTTWNAARRIQGQLESDLSELGRSQAAGNGQRLREIRSDIDTLPFVASPLRRCRNTMEIIRNELGLDPKNYTTDDRLKEIHFGFLQDTYWSDFAPRYPEQAAAREADPYHWRPDGGESYADLLTRTAGWLKELRQDTLVVSHGGVSRALRGNLYDIDPVEMTELKVPQDKILVLRKSEHHWL
ncbi:MAG: histidine phosphatase family protein [Pseudomonadota bacterium]